MPAPPETTNVPVVGLVDAVTEVNPTDPIT